MRDLEIEDPDTATLQPIEDSSLSRISCIVLNYGGLREVARTEQHDTNEAKRCILGGPGSWGPLQPRSLFDGAGSR